MTFYTIIMHISGTNASNNMSPKPLKIQPEVVASVYKDWVMPLTKVGFEVMP
jgi:hypothetical protein